MAEDIGAHQLERLVELLTSKECEDLLLALSHPEENIFQHLERLSPEKNQLDVKPRAKRDTSSAAGYAEHHLTHISPETWAYLDQRQQLTFNQVTQIERRGGSLRHSLYVCI